MYVSLIDIYARAPLWGCSFQPDQLRINDFVAVVC